MKKMYKGYELEVTREKNKYNNYLSYSIYDTKDGHCVMESYTEGSETVLEMYDNLKDYVDNYCD